MLVEGSLLIQRIINNSATLRAKSGYTKALNKVWSAPPTNC